MSINRRSLVKGAAWAAPVVIASASVPAYAASKKQQYFLGSSWSTKTTFTRNTTYCGTSKVYYNTIDFNTATSANGNPAGFAVMPRSGTTDITNVTLSRFTLKVAFPAGIISSFTVTSGSYTVSGPTRVTIDGIASDAFTFTFTGTKTGKSLAAGNIAPSWTGSVLQTKVNFNPTVCAPLFDHYYAQFSEAFTTANGYSEDFTSNWIYTQVV